MNTMRFDQIQWVEVEGQWEWRGRRGCVWSRLFAGFSSLLGV